MKNLIRFLGIIAFVAIIMFSFASCGDGAEGNDTPGDLGGVISKPPSSPGPGGVWVDGDGNLKISNAPIYMMNKSNPPKIVQAPVSLNTGVEIYSWVDEEEVLWPSTGDVVDGFLSDITIHLPPLSALAFPTEWDEIPMPSSFIKTGATTRAGFFTLFPEDSEHLGLLYDPYVVKETGKHNEEYYRVYGKKEYMYFYSEGEIVISGSGTFTYDEELIKSTVDIKFTKGWNVVCMTEDETGDNWSYTMVSASPTENLQWVEIGMMNW